MLIILQVFLYVNVLYCVEIPFVAAQDTCYSNQGCSSDKVCCKNLSSSVFQCRDIKRFDIASKHRSETSCLPCCDRSWSWIESRAWNESRQYGKCSKSCIGMRCRARIHSDCGAGECCRSLRCVNCSDTGCMDHFDCPNNQYCCKEWINGTRRCMRNCIRKKCSSDEECGLSEHCHMRRYCQRGTSCRVEGNDSCDDGLFYKEACITSNDCRRMHFAWCVNGSCSLKKCSFRSDCVVGCVRRYCCTISYSDTKACSLYRCDGGKRFGRYAFGHNDSCFRGDINNDHSRMLCMLIHVQALHQYITE